MNERFKALINSEKPVLVDFYADWCEPCKLVAPMLKTVKKDFRQVKVAKVNVDHNPVIAHAFGIRSLPTVILFKKGKPQLMVIGLESVNKIREVVGNYL